MGLERGREPKVRRRHERAAKRLGIRVDQTRRAVETLADLLGDERAVGAELASNDHLTQLLDKLAAGGVPAGRIFRAKDMLADPHFAARESIVRVVHPDLGDVAMQNVFPRLSATPGTVRHPGPELGEHNEEIYRGLLGLSEQELGRLREAGVI